MLQGTALKNCILASSGNSLLDRRPTLNAKQNVWKIVQGIQGLRPPDRQASLSNKTVRSSGKKTFQDMQGQHHSNMSAIIEDRLGFSQVFCWSSARPPTSIVTRLPLPQGILPHFPNLICCFLYCAHCTLPEFK